MHTTVTPRVSFRMSHTNKLQAGKEREGHLVGLEGCRVVSHLLVLAASKQEAEAFGTGVLVPPVINALFERFEATLYGVANLAMELIFGRTLANSVAAS